MLLPLFLQCTTIQPTTAQQATGDKLFGVVEENIAANPGTGKPSRIQQMQLVGAKVVRLPYSWRLMEGEGKGKTPQWFWDGLDADVAAAEKAGIKVILELAQTPCWASSDPQKKCSSQDNEATWSYRPTNVNDYADAVGRLAQRYGSRIYAWEIWNEPNLLGNYRNPECGGSGTQRGICSRPAAMNDPWNTHVSLAIAPQYAELVKATYRKLKAINPNAIVLAGSLAGSDVDYLNQLYSSGIKGYFDALAMHPYTSTYDVSPGDPKYGWEYGPDECSSNPKVSKFWCFKQGVESTRQAMLAQGDNKPIWFSEFGFSSATPQLGSAVGWNGAGLQGQATYLQKAIDIIRGWDFVKVACWYQLVDRSTNNEREAMFGLFDTQQNIKPAGVAFKQAVASNKPILLSPQGDINTNIPTFTWQAVPGATLYKLWVNEYSSPSVPGKIDRNFTPAQANCTSGSTCSVSPVVQFASASAEWWITAYFNNGTSQLGDSMKFTVKASTSKPVQLSPKGTISTKQPIYRWLPFPGATQYFIWVNQYGSKTSDAVPGKIQVTVTPSQAKCSASGCSFQPSTALIPGGAEWWVTAISATGNKTVSDGLYFQIQN